MRTRTSPTGMLAVAGACAFLFLGERVHAEATNLVVNGDFETGTFSGWTEIGNTELNGVQCPGAQDVPQGNCDAYFGPSGSLGGIEQLLATTSGVQYVVSFAFSGDGGTPGAFRVDFGNQTLVNLVDPSTIGFQTYTFNAIATSANTVLRYQFRDDPGFLELDNVTVSAVPEPASLGMLLAGLGLVGALKVSRRRL